MHDGMRQFTKLSDQQMFIDFCFSRMHHACALQRLHLVKLFLACLDFNIDAKDCEGNTCLHYVAITGRKVSRGKENESMRFSRKL